MAQHARYRIEDGVHCVDIRIDKLDRLFDNRDPAPFRERDLDPALVEYLFDAAEDLASHGPFRVIFWLAAGPDAGRSVIEKVEPAFRSHFAYELDRIDRQRTRLRRTGHISLVIAVTLLLALVSLAQLATRIPTVGPALREGLTIAGWVVMWRPVQRLVYEWVPLRRERKLMARLHQAPLDVRRGAPPVRSASRGGAARRAPHDVAAESPVGATQDLA